MLSPLSPFYLICELGLTVFSHSSDGVPKIPSVTLKFATNNSFVVHDPVFVIYGTQVGSCNHT